MSRHLIILLLLFPLSLFSQKATQTIRGQVIDKDTKQPLIGATVSVAVATQSIGTTTDIDGSYILEDVPVGRHGIVCQYLGYDPFYHDGVILNSAKELFLNIEMIESAVQMDEVVITAGPKANRAINELAMVSTRSFSVEETQRYAASVNDPGRMATGFPGVQVSSRDTRSDIVIRGNSGVGLLWRLEGVDILNPNHFARRGSSGGGISIFSVSMLADSDFSTGAFPAEYGNAFSGVFDMKFRNGNLNRPEYTFRAGILGLDFSTEGPIKKGKSSYLVNYRYSTLGILNSLGIHLVGERIDNRFQDLSFKLHFKSSNNKHIVDFWGIGGTSDENQEAEEDQADWVSFDDFKRYDFQTDMGVLGLNYTYLIDEKSYLKTSLAVMGQRVIYQEDTLNLELNPGIYLDEEYTNTRVTLSSVYNRKLSGRAALKVGLIANRLGYDLVHQALLNESTFHTYLNEQDHTYMLQPYVSLRYAASERWTFTAGLHSLFFTLNNTSSIEPRLGMQYRLNERSNLSFAYGLHSRTLPIGTYFTQIPGLSQQDFPNLDLELIKSHHFVLAYDLSFGKATRLHAETYYQHLFDVPISANSNFSILNQIEGYGIRALVSEGTGTNYGLDLSLEQAFSNNLFYILAGSIFNSTYENADGESFNTIYNSNYTLSLTGGKEWKVKERGTFQTGLRVLTNGGQRFTPIQSNSRSFEDPELPILDDENPFTEKIDAYIRADIRFAYRRDNPKSSWILALDIQNALNRQHFDVFTRMFNAETGEWEFREQGALTPVLSFQIDF